MLSVVKLEPGQEPWESRVSQFRSLRLIRFSGRSSELASRRYRSVSVRDRIGSDRIRFRLYSVHMVIIGNNN